MINSTSYRSYQLRVTTDEKRFDEISYRTPYWQRILNIIEARWQQYAIHALLWALLYFLPLLFSFSPGTHIAAYVPGVANAGHFVSFLLLAGFSYLNYYYMVPCFYLQKKNLQYFFLVALCLCALLVFQNITAPASAAIIKYNFHSYLPALNYINVLFLLITLVTIILHQRKRLVKNELEIMKMKMSVLNAQINPHFLFNSLNWIYLLSIGDSGQTPEAIIQLSGLMRYVMKDANAEFADLKKELHYIKNYLSLQQGRLGDTVSLNYRIPDYYGSLKIAPLAAMSFIENAFKYGINPDEDSAINIDITVTSNRFCLQIINNKVSVMNIAGNGVGIENTKQRLNLLYPGLHQLEILDELKIYSVKLSITLL